MNASQFWEKFDQAKRELDDAFKKGDQFHVGYQLGILHTLREYGMSELGIPFSLLSMEEK